MNKLKKKIISVEPLPNDNKKIEPTKIITTIIIIIIFSLIAFFVYIKLLPVINGVNINRIKGKRAFITTCNTKDYVIIAKDKTYSLSLTNDNCEPKYYEGTISIENRVITFNKKISGIIDDDYNIIINNNKFEVENGEWRVKKYA